MNQAQSPLQKNVISKEIARAAAQWLMRLYSGESTIEDIKACKQWREAHPAHEQAWQRVQKIQAKLNLIPAETGMKTLDRKIRISRRNALKTLVTLIIATPVGYVAYGTNAWQSWSSDYSTSKGQQFQTTLADGSQLHLNTDTIVDIKFTDQQRLIVLHQGEILIESGKDRTHLLARSRPLIVQTSQGELQPLGTRFIVRKLSNKPRTQLSVLEGIVEVRTRSGTASKQVQAGRQTLLSVDKIASIMPIVEHVDAWSKGFFYARNMRLEDFLQEISRYRPGILRFDPAVAELRISGIFQINNTDQILSALPDTLPVSVRYQTAYWVSIHPRIN